MNKIFNFKDKLKNKKIKSVNRSSKLDMQLYKEYLVARGFHKDRI